MPMSSKQKRMDEIWAQLTPKDWGIWLADHIRKYQSLDDFMKAVAKGTNLEESPQFIPLFALDRQAEERQRGWKPEDANARDKLSRKLRTEFLALKTLVVEVNKTVQIKVETNGLRPALASIQSLILKDVFGRTAEKAAEWMNRQKTADAREESERRLVLDELAPYVDGSFLEMPCGKRLRLPFASLIQSWVEGSTALILDILGHKAAVQVVQEKYFDGHPILFRDIEAAQEEEIQKTLTGVTAFQSYLEARADLFSRECEQAASEDGATASTMPTEREAHVGIDLEAIQNRAKTIQADAMADAWVERAKDQAVIDILDETGEARAFFWERFREAAGVQL